MSEFDLENLSDLDNFLALAEAFELENNEMKNIKNINNDNDDDCSIVNIVKVQQDYSKNLKRTSSLTQSLQTVSKRVQLSISNFFKPPKRLPQEQVDYESKPKANAKVPTSTTIPIPIPTKTRKVPKFKFIPGTSFAVDAFSYGALEGITGYFLTHFHSDHYKGLTNKLLTPSQEDAPRLYCSEVTGNLVRAELKIKAGHITTLKIGHIYMIEGIHIGVLDANHCPGSVMFIFGVPMLNTTSGMKWHLHCGDFRADPLIICEQTLSYFEGDSMPARRLHFKDFLFESIYLDTTYAHPKHSFPPQNQVISACVEGCRKLLAGACVNPQGQRLLVPLKWLIAVGSYLIGKERIILALAIAFDLPIYADSRKRSILGLLNWPELEDRLTDDPLSTPLHLVSMSLLGKKKLSDYMESFKGTFTHILGIRPTGWTFDDQTSSAGEASSVFSLSMPKIDGNAGVWPVPYSEHSSYRELDEFLKEISFHQLIPTVDNWGDVVLDSRRSGNSSSSLLSQWSLRRKPNKY